MNRFVRPAPEGADPFGTAALRAGVLDAWAASAARFREDANAEEDLALGGYRDRLVVELAQNAADAAARAGVPGKLRLTLRGDVLAVANTGAPLDATGVESLSTLRASAKRDEPVPAAGPDGGAPPTVGRFGVGFSAVLAVSDEPAVLGRHGGVRWSLAEARALVEQRAKEAGPDGSLAAELQRREGHVPLLRLPFAAEGAAPDPYDTVIVLPLRDAAAEDLVRRLLDEIDDALLLTLPGLAEVAVETGGEEGGAPHVRTLTRGADGPYTVVDDSRDGRSRWRVLGRGGPLDAELLRDRPVEERQRPWWSLTWAVPVDAEGGPLPPRTAPVVHAPTPGDEPLGMPALLIASFPLDPTRRHTAPGPLTDHLVARAADAYAELLGSWRPLSVSVLSLVPGPLGKGALDGALRQAVLDRLRTTAFLPPAVEGGAAVSSPDTGPGDELPGLGLPGLGLPEPDAADLGLPAREAADLVRPGSELPGTADRSAPEALRPREAELVEGAGAETVRVLAEVLPHLLPGGLERRGELRTLGVTRVPLTEAVDRLIGVDREPSWWRRLYDSLAGVDPDRLSGLPVPLAGQGARTAAGAGATSRTAIGPRHVLLPVGPQSTSRAVTPTGAAGTGSERGEGSVGGEGPDTDAGLGDLDPAVLAGLGLKVAHPEAAHPLLEKLGARPATAHAVLTTPQVRAAVAASLENDSWNDSWEDPLDAGKLARTVLTLVRQCGLEPGDEPWLGALALPDEDGELAPACELVLPGSEFARLMHEDELPLLDAEWAEEWGEQPLAGCGVIASFALVQTTDLVLDPDELEPREGDFTEPDDAGLLDAVDVWCEDVLDQLPDTPLPPVAAELFAVRDLDTVDDDRWPEALALLSKPPFREAVTTQVRVLMPDGSTRSVRPYTAWWLRGQPVLDGRRPAGLRAEGSDPLLGGLYDSADATGFEDEQFLRALGVRTSVAALLAEPGGAAELLERLADPGREVTGAQLHALYGHLAGLDPEQVTLPEELRAVRDGEVVVVDAADALVADAPDLLPLAAGRALLPVRPGAAAALAELFQVRRLSAVAGAAVPQGGTVRPVPDSVRTLLGPDTPETYSEYEELVLDGVEFDWRRTPDGAVHAATVEGVAAGLARAAGQWPRRFEVAALLEDPSRTEELARDRWFD